LASEIVVDNRTLDAVLRDLSEQGKENAARADERFGRLEAQMKENAARVDERFARVEAQMKGNAARVDERFAQVDERCARLDDTLRLVLRTISSVHQDLIGLRLEVRAFTERTETRLDALEKVVGA